MYAQMHHHNANTEARLDHSAEPLANTDEPQVKQQGKQATSVPAHDARMTKRNTKNHAHVWKNKLGKNRRVLLRTRVPPCKKRRVDRPRQRTKPS